MKKAASLFLVIWTLLMVQPAFAYFGGKAAYGACAKKEPAKPVCSKSKATTSSCAKKKAASSGCTKKACNNSSTSGKKGKCTTESCNPTLGCASGNFYIHHHFQISFASLFANKQKAVVTDDNRIVKSMSECWHPPEA